MGLTLRGLAWDHERCWGPLDASVAPWRADHPGLDIVWDRRSLYEFGEGRIEEAVRNYDLVIFDHPFVGEIARDGLMVPLDDYLSEDVRRSFAEDSVGRSWESYSAGGRQWALPIDAAAQVAAYRPDLLQAHTGAVPKTHDEMIGLARRLRAAGKWMGLPLIPTDAMCLVFTLAAGGGAAIAPSRDLFLDRAAVEDIVERLREMAGLVHPQSFGWNPIRCYEHMIHHDDVVYVPYAFGYVNYAARREEPHLRFADIPDSPPRGALLGGAGIGISAQSENRQVAIDYALHLCSPGFQRGAYVQAGGQPASLSAWTDPAANEATRGFFRDTLKTLQGSYLRQTHPGFISFFRDGTHQVAAAIKGEISAAALAAWLNLKHAETSPRALDRSFA
jgi:multiple sugar transport system substrate-binding protein